MEQLLKEILEEAKKTNRLLESLIDMERTRTGCQDKNSKEMMDKLMGIMAPFSQVLARVGQPKTGG